MTPTIMSWTNWRVLCLGGAGLLGGKNTGGQSCNVSQMDEMLNAYGMQMKCNITLAYRTIVSI